MQGVVSSLEGMEGLGCGSAGGAARMSKHSQTMCSLLPVLAGFDWLHGVVRIS